MEQPLIAMENYLAFSPAAYQVISHVLTLGMAAMAAGLVYFLATAKLTSPKYRLSSYLSAVVMASAVLELGLQAWHFSSAFVPSGAGGAFELKRGALFANGFRYANWSIDVPVLLTQMLVVLGVVGRPFWKYWAQFTFAGLAMIWTGYIGQYHQAVPVGEGAVAQTGPYWLWFVVSSLFFAWLLVLVFRVVGEYRTRLPDNARGLMDNLRWLLFGSWMLYPVAYLCPAIAFTAESAVSRQILYTVADVSSKVAYGVILGRIAVKRSAAEGYEMAQAQEQRGSEEPVASRSPGLPQGVGVAQVAVGHNPAST